MMNPVGILVNLRNSLFWSALKRKVSSVPVRAIDLGSGTNPKNDFGAEEVWSLDIVDSKNTRHVVCDATHGPLPLDNDYFDIVTAYDFLEHVPRVNLANNETTFPFVTLMNEIHRILKPGGHFYSYTPVFPKKSAFQDPTHVNIMTKDTLQMYFCGPNPVAEIYGFSGGFDMLRSGWKGTHHYALMKKSEHPKSS